MLLVCSFKTLIQEGTWCFYFLFAGKLQQLEDLVREILYYVAQTLQKCVVCVLDSPKAVYFWRIWHCFSNVSEESAQLRLLYTYIDQQFRSCEILIAWLRMAVSFGAWCRMDEFMRSHLSVFPHVYIVLLAIYW